MHVESQAFTLRCRLRELREAHKMTQAEVAAYLEVEVAAVSKYELNQRNIPAIKIAKLLQLFHCTFDVLYEY